MTDRDKANKYVNKYMDVYIPSQSFSIVLHLRITSHKWSLLERGFARVGQANLFNPR